MGPIIAAIIIVAGIAGIFNFLVVPALDTKSREVPAELDDGGEHEAEGSHGDSHTSQGEMKVPFELDEAILVNIQGENNVVLSAKVGFLLKTTAHDDTGVTLMEEHLAKFKSMLIAAARGYLVELDENDLNVPEKVHRDRLKTRLNTVFNRVRGYDHELGKLLKDDPVEEVFLPNFTHQ